MSKDSASTVDKKVVEAEATSAVVDVRSPAAGLAGRDQSTAQVNLDAPTSPAIEYEDLLMEQLDREQAELETLFRWTMTTAAIVVTVKTIAGIFFARQVGASVRWDFLLGFIPTVRVGVTGTTFTTVLIRSTVAVVLVAVLWSQLGLAWAAYRSSWGLAWGTFLAVPMSGLLILFELLRFSGEAIDPVWTLRLVVIAGLAAVSFAFFKPVLPDLSDINYPTEGGASE